MLKRLSLYITLVFGFSITNAQEENLFCDQLQALKQTVKEFHYQPKIVDDTLSTHVFDLFLDTLDEDKRLFIQNDIDTFEKDRFELDNYISDKSCSFIDKYVTKLTERIENSKVIIAALQTEVFDYSGKDTLRFKPESRFLYFKDDAAAKRYWSKRMRYNILYALV